MLVVSLKFKTCICSSRSTLGIHNGKEDMKICANIHKALELMSLNCGAGEDSWESLGQ